MLYNGNGYGATGCGVAIAVNGRELVPIPFNVPLVNGRELDYIREAIANRSSCRAMVRSHENARRGWSSRLGAAKALLTHSCTAALEMAAMLSEVGVGDEVIMPSFTFVSTANAFVLRGATPVFVDIRDDTCNLDETLDRSRDHAADKSDRARPLCGSRLQHDGDQSTLPAATSCW